jgi:1,4-dihydroxy-2-naphthoate octaprenyltransferase
LLIGLLSIFAGIAYTAGPYPLAYNGLGDIFVFLFFGFVGTVGTYYVQAVDIVPLVIWASVPVGALITNILVVNNYRDVDEDMHAGKNTLAVKFGKRFTRFQYLIFMIISYLILVVVYFTLKQSIFIFLPLLTLPLAIRLINMIFTYEGEKLNKTLELTAKLSALYGLLFAFGILL